MLNKLKESDFSIGSGSTIGTGHSEERGDRYPLQVSSLGASCPRYRAHLLPKWIFSPDYR